jgi:hypothetical protein
MNFAVREKVSLVQLERPCLSFLTRSITAAVDNPSPRTKASKTIHHVSLKCQAAKEAYRKYGPSTDFEISLEIQLSHGRYQVTITGANGISGIAISTSITEKSMQAILADN